MKSIEKLRKAIYGMPETDEYSIKDELHNLAYAVEREIAERYMELPVDADGVPIHVCDVIQFVNEQGGTGAHVEVDAVSKHYAYYGEGKHFYKASMCRHVKPDPVKELLEEFLETGGCIPKDWTSIIEKYTAKIREAVSAE